MSIDREWLKKIIGEALREDIGKGDVTTSLVIDKGCWAKAEIIVQEKGILAGLDVAKEVFLSLDPEIEFKKEIEDGKDLFLWEVVASLKGQVSSILTAERVALNFLSRLSGIATLTRAFVEKAKKYNVLILNTRKTTPLLRPLERYAVRVGGGQNHRDALDKGILIKDNHLVATNLTRAIEKARQERPEGMNVEVETHNMDQVKEAIRAAPEIIMLDNMKGEQLREAVELVRKEAPEILIEVSGGVTLENVEEIANLKIDMISVGSLTHSPKSLDFSLEVKECSCL